MSKQTVFKKNEKVCLRKDYRKILGATSLYFLTKEKIIPDETYEIMLNVIVYGECQKHHMIILNGRRYKHLAKAFKRAPVQPVQLQIGDIVRLKSNWRNIAAKVYPYFLHTLTRHLRDSNLLDESGKKCLTSSILDVSPSLLTVGPRGYGFQRTFFQKVSIKNLINN